MSRVRILLVICTNSLVLCRAGGLVGSQVERSNPNPTWHKTLCVLAGVLTSVFQIDLHLPHCYHTRIFLNFFFFYLLSLLFKLLVHYSLVMVSPPIAIAFRVHRLHINKSEAMTTPFRRPSYVYCLRIVQIHRSRVKFLLNCLHRVNIFLRIDLL